MVHRSGMDLFCHRPPPEEERAYRPAFFCQPGWDWGVFQMAWGSGRTSSWSPQRSSFSPRPQSMSS